MATPNKVWFISATISPLVSCPHHDHSSPSPRHLPPAFAVPPGLQILTTHFRFNETTRPPRLGVVWHTRHFLASVRPQLVCAIISGSLLDIRHRHGTSLCPPCRLPPSLSHHLAMAGYELSVHRFRGVHSWWDRAHVCCTDSLHSNASMTSIFHDYEKTILCYSFEDNFKPRTIQI
jgi:hypothetical protein